jgi:hypothetical protein
MDLQVLVGEAQLVARTALPGRDAHTFRRRLALRVPIASPTPHQDHRPDRKALAHGCDTGVSGGSRCGIRPSDASNRGGTTRTDIARGWYIVAAMAAAAHDPRSRRSTPASHEHAIADQVHQLMSRHAEDAGFASGWSSAPRSAVRFS